jgi:hypothetical protein
MSTSRCRSMRPEGTDGDTPYFLFQRQFESPEEMTG